MITTSRSLYKFKSLITINSNAANPALEDYANTSREQSSLSTARRSSQVYGMDFLMFSEGGFFGENGKLKKAAGIYNYAQAITHRLSTQKGTMPEDPTFGVDWNRYLGKSYRNKTIILANIEADVTEEALRDRRTADIPKIETRFVDPNTVSIELLLVPVFTSVKNYQDLLISFTASQSVV